MQVISEQFLSETQISNESLFATSTGKSIQRGRIFFSWNAF